jgi:hypothetical protein
VARQKEQTLSRRQVKKITLTISIPRPTTTQSTRTEPPRQAPNRNHGRRRIRASPDNLTTAQADDHSADLDILTLVLERRGGRRDQEEKSFPQVFIPWNRPRSVRRPSSIFLEPLARPGLPTEFGVKDDVALGRAGTRLWRGYLSWVGHTSLSARGGALTRLFSSPLRTGSST